MPSLARDWPHLTGPFCGAALKFGIILNIMSRSEGGLVVPVRRVSEEKRHD